MDLIVQWVVLPFLVSLASFQSLAFEKAETFNKSENKFKVLVFLSRSCPCSRSHVEHLNRLEVQFKDVSFFGVITDIFDEESSEEIKNYYASKSFKFPLIKDPQQKLVKRYRALKTPHSVLLKKLKNNKYKVIYEGGVTSRRSFSSSNKKFLEENLAAVTKDKPLKYTAGKSLGCYIRRI